MTKTQEKLIGTHAAIVLFALLALTGKDVSADEGDGDPIAAIKKLGGRVIPDKAVAPSNVTEVNFLNSNVTDADLGLLKSFVNLKKLDLRLTKVTGVGLQELSELAELTDLDLSSTLATDEGLRVLQNLLTLEKLSLNDTQLTDEGLAQLTQAGQSKLTKKLIHLSLAGTQVTDEGLKVLGEFKRLKALNLSRTAVTVVGLTNLKGLEKALTGLDLSGRKVVGESWGLSFKVLRLFQKLEDLSLADTLVTDFGVSQLCTNSDLGHGYEKPLLKLKKLDLSRCQVTDEALQKHLGKLPKLTNLVLSGTDITGEGLKNLRLKELDLSGTLLTDEVLEGFQSYKSRLVASTVGMVSPLGHGPILATSALALGSITESLLLESLELLTIADTSVTDKGLRLLEKFPHLQKLEVNSNTKVTRAGLLRWKNYPRAWWTDLLFPKSVQQVLLR